MIEWLSPPDPWKNHHVACESRHSDSAAWFVQGNTFSEWKVSEALSSLLWVHGKRSWILGSGAFQRLRCFFFVAGAGKSVFWCVKLLIFPSLEFIVLASSTIIEDIDGMRKAGLASLAFFYCDFREERKTSLRGILSSLLVQLCHQSDSYYDVLFRFYSEHTDGFRHPSDKALMGCLKDLLKLSNLAPVYLIVDALDECPKIPAIRSPRSQVLNLIAELINLKFPNLRICVTSRPATDIKDVLDPLIPHYVSLHDERGQKRDIDEYIKSVIKTHPETGSWKEENMQLVIDVLTERADGM